MADDDAAHWAEVARRAEARAAARSAAGAAPAASSSSSSSSAAVTARQRSDSTAATAPPPAPAAPLVVHEGYPCATCGELVPPGVTAAAHATSLLHQLAKEAPHARQLHLTEANKGYQLLQRMGWKEDRGLGAAGQGRLQPVPSVLKEDRRGLGSSRRGAGGESSSSAAAAFPAPHAADGTARVTHFPSHSEAEAARSRDGLSRAQREQQLRGTYVAAAPSARTHGNSSGGGGVSSSSAASSGSHRHGGGGDMTARAAQRQAQRDAHARDARREARRLAAIRAEVCRDDDLPDHLLAVLTGGGPPAKRHKKG